tara:strand:+ start:15700 stop:16584 length:885 start_codon:yes stop_codon:yes gene_type:complete
MIISEKGVRKIIREAIRFRQPEGPTIDSDDPRYRCNLSALRDADDETWAAGVLVFLSRLLFFSPTGMSDKSLLQQLDLFLSTGQRNLTPDENEQYNQAIKKILSSGNYKNTLIDRIENVLDVMFFPTASAVCNIINSYYEASSFVPAAGSAITSSDEEKVASIVAALESSSKKMLREMRLRDFIPSYQILFPATFLAISQGKDRSEYREIFRQENDQLINTIFNKDSQDVSRLNLAIKKIHRGTGNRRTQELRLSPLDNYFENIIIKKDKDNYKIAKKIKEEIRNLIANQPISI